MGINLSTPPRPPPGRTVDDQLVCLRRKTNDILIPLSPPPLQLISCPITPEYPLYGVVLRSWPFKVGATNAMRVEAVAKDGKRKAILNYAHEDLEVCVGIATAAFAAATLRGDVSYFVYINIYIYAVHTWCTNI